MARSREETKVNLFPFLSVLCAVIGVMILFIVLTLGTRGWGASPHHNLANLTY